MRQNGDGLKRAFRATADEGDYIESGIVVEDPEPIDDVIYLKIRGETMHNHLVMRIDEALTIITALSIAVNKCTTGLSFLPQDENWLGEENHDEGN